MKLSLNRIIWTIVIFITIGLNNANAQYKDPSAKDKKKNEQRIKKSNKVKKAKKRKKRTYEDDPFTSAKQKKVKLNGRKVKSKNAKNPFESKDKSKINKRKYFKQQKKNERRSNRKSKKARAKAPKNKGSSGGQLE